MRSMYACYPSTPLSRVNLIFLKTRTNPACFRNSMGPSRAHLSFETSLWRRIAKHGNKYGSVGAVHRIAMAFKENSSNREQGGMEKRGTIVGAVSLIIGTSIGSGILALPQKTSPAGFIPSAATITICWLFLVIEALLLAEINVHLRQRWMKDDKKESSDLEVISLRTMSLEMLGEWGGNLATVTYLFLAYTSMVAYTAKSGDVLSQLLNLPNSILGIVFTLLLALLILVGGTQTTDRVNQWLTISMIGLLLVIEVMALSFYGWMDSMTISNWEKVPQAIPVIVFSLVYHDIAPGSLPALSGQNILEWVMPEELSTTSFNAVICAYLGGDLLRIRISILFGSIVPFVSLLIWDGIALDLSPNLDGIDPLDFLMRGSWSNMLPIVHVFSLLAVGTSLIGTLLGFSQFFMEQLANMSPSLPSLSGKLKVDFWDNLANDEIGPESGRNRLEGNRLALLAMTMAVLPSVLISTVVPDAFSVATDVAGGYCMTILYGVLPPAMAWTMHSRSAEINDIYEDKVQVNAGRFAFSKVKPLLIGVGLLSCGIVMEEVFMDFFLADLQ